jgi:exportin-5
LDLIKVIASQRPVIAAASIVQRINFVFGDANQATKSPEVGLAAYVYHINSMFFISILDFWSKKINLCTLNFLFQDLDAMEGAQLGLEAVVSAIFDGLVDCGKTDLEMKSQLHKIFEGFTQPNFWTNYCGLQCAKFPYFFQQAYFSSFFL